MAGDTGVEAYFLLPSGEGGAKRRMRVRPLNTFNVDASPNPHPPCGHPLPRGEGTAVEPRPTLPCDLLEFRHPQLVENPTEPLALVVIQMRQQAPFVFERQRRDLVVDLPALGSELQD